jgi:hypothetical protein
MGTIIRDFSLPPVHVLSYNFYARRGVRVVYGAALEIELLFRDYSVFTSEKLNERAQILVMIRDYSKTENR